MSENEIKNNMQLTVQLIKTIVISTTSHNGYGIRITVRIVTGAGSSYPASKLVLIVLCQESHASQITTNSKNLHNLGKLW